MLLLCLSLSVAAEITITTNWDVVTARAATAATIEVDVMPFLGRTDYGGPFNAYYTALSNLGSEYVRYAPWFPNPRVVVTELTPSDCTKTSPATNWNSTFFDEIMSDFMTAVCGPNAVNGDCKRSVVQQLSTMPSWMYVGGMDPSKLPENPWDTTDPFSAYAAGNELVDKTCMQMATYFGRLVGWYTAGGMTDECGHFHPSGLHYDWYGISVLNEDEHHIKPEDGVAYTVCYDAIKKEVAKVNPAVILVGPEIINGAPLQYMKYFLNASNHDDNEPPQIASYHWGTSTSGAQGAKFFTDWDAFLKSNVDPIGDFKRQLGSETELVLNEYIPFLSDWCDCTGHEKLCGGAAFPDKCPDWQDQATAGGDPNLQHGAGIGINKKTVGWNAAGAVFAYGFGTLAEREYKYVGQDQLIGGTWPDNEPAVSCMDWNSGQVNAKYWVTNLLAATVGTKETKAFSMVKVSDDATVYALPYTINGRGKGFLIVNKTPHAVSAKLAGVGVGTASCVEVTEGVDEPGFAPQIVKQFTAGKLELGGFAVCVVTQFEAASSEKAEL